jgi:Na+/citrate or Na+/malate symporter
MRRFKMFLLVVLIPCLAGGAGAGTPLLFAQAQAQQQKFEEEVRFAQNIERLSYVLVGVGFLLIVASIPVGIYWDRRKKARRRAEQREDRAG